LCYDKLEKEKSGDELTAQFMHDMSVRNGIVASNLLSPTDAPTPKTKGRRWGRPSLESVEQVLVPNDVRSESQRPLAPKKARDDRSHGAQQKHVQAAPTVDSRAPEEAEFKRVSNGTTRRQSRKQHGKKSGVPSPADLNPC